MFHTVVLCRFNSVISSVPVFWGKKKDYAGMKCDLNTETHCYAEALTWAAVRSWELASSKRMNPFSYAVDNSSQVTIIAPTQNQLLFTVHSIVHCGHRATSMQW